MEYHLFTVPHRCVPCRALESQLESIPDWKNKIEYINADDMTEVQKTLAEKVKVFKLPSLTTDKNIVVVNTLGLFNKIKEICTSE